MLQQISYFCSLALLAVAAFFGISAFSIIVNLYLRKIDHLSIDQEDITKLIRYSLLGVGLIGMAMLVRSLLLPMAITAFLIVLLTFQILKVNNLINRLK